MRLKPAAADPWQALPRLADLFDAQAPQLFFKGSKVPELEELALTETQLLEQTAALLGVSLAQLVRAAALVYAKREFLNHKKFSAAAQDGSEGGGGALLRSGSGVAGVADARIQAAYQTLADSKQPVTPAKLATRALTGYPCAGLKSITPYCFCLNRRSLPRRLLSQRLFPRNKAPKPLKAHRNNPKPPQGSGVLPLKLKHFPSPSATPRAIRNCWPTIPTLKPHRNSRNPPGGIMIAPRRKSPPNAALTPRTSLFNKPLL